MQISKDHHLVPRTYLRPWCYSGDSVFVVDKATGKVENKNINTNFAKRHYHTITAGMPVCNEADLKLIFACLSDYKVFYKNKELVTLEEYNNHYSFFSEWDIYKGNIKTSKREKNSLRAHIDGIKITEIEDLWSKQYEDKWPVLRSFIEQRLEMAIGRTIPSFCKGLLMKFVVSMNWRGFIGNESFKESYKLISNSIEFDKIDIPLKERLRPYLETASEEMEHLLLLKNYREFLNNSGNAYEMAKGYIRHLNILFWVAPEKLSFMTSDNPSYISRNIEGEIMHIMPVNPKILITIGKNSDNANYYLIKTASDADVKRVNRDILKNCVDRAISIDKQSLQI